MRMNDSMGGCLDCAVGVVENGRTKEVHWQVMLLSQMMGVQR